MKTSRKATRLAQQIWGNLRIDADAPASAHKTPGSLLDSQHHVEALTRCIQEILDAAEAKERRVEGVVRLVIDRLTKAHTFIAGLRRVLVAVQNLPPGCALTTELRGLVYDAANRKSSSLRITEEGAWAVDPAELPTRRGPGQLPAAVEQEEGA